MDTKEMRELDAWIAEHVMGWKISFRAGEVEIWRTPSGTAVFHPTTDPAAAMEVLKKCGERACTTVYRTKGAWVVTSSILVGAEADAPTPELAICLFAKALFGPK